MTTFDHGDKFMTQNVAPSELLHYKVAVHTSEDVKDGTKHVYVEVADSGGHSKVWWYMTPAEAAYLGGVLHGASLKCQEPKKRFRRRKIDGTGNQVVTEA